MRTPFMAVPLILGSCASVPSPAQGPPTSTIVRSSKFDVYVGVRSLDEHDWSPVEDQGTLGLEYIHEAPGSTVGFEIALFASGDTKDNVAIPGGGTVDVRGRTSELAVGIRKTFAPDGGGVHPYVGGGLAAIKAEFKGSAGGVSAEDDDGSAALYLHGGLDFDVGPSFFLGIDLRFLGGSDVTLFGANGSADYGQLALVIGWRF
jgi:opacity protein-like surface antigen